MKDETNSQIAFPYLSPKDVFTNTIHCIKQLKNVKCRTNFSNSKHAKKL